MPEKTQGWPRDLSCYTVERKIDSRKNDVYLLKTNKSGEEEKHLIYKKYSDPEKLPVEKEMLKLLHDKKVAVPQIYSIGEDYMLIEYLGGPLLLDFFCWQENIRGAVDDALRGPTYQIIYSLCSWFRDFYSALREDGGRQLIMGDVNFRNFIIREKVYGMDLEECREGKIEEEIGSFCAFALTYSPPFTPWKSAMVRELLRVFSEEMKLDRAELKEETRKSLSLMFQRRPFTEETVKRRLSEFMEKGIDSI